MGDKSNVTGGYPEYAKPLKPTASVINVNANVAFVTYESHINAKAGNKLPKLSINILVDVRVKCLSPINLSN